MKIRIGITNYADYVQPERLFDQLDEDVEFIMLNDLFTDMEANVRRIEAEGSVDAFISSGGNGRHLKQYLKRIPMVEIETTGYDILNAIFEAKQFSNSMAFLFYSPFPQLEKIRSVLDADLKLVEYKSPYDLDLIFRSLSAEGICDVIGSVFETKQAQLYGLRGHCIRSDESIRSAIERAIALVRSRKEFEEKARTLDYLMEFSAEGIIITDKDGKITQFNDSAERIMGRSRKSVIGKDCADVLPNTQLHTVIRERRAQYNRVQNLGKVKIVTNRSPIICNKEVVGALATFFNANTIMQAGDNIRKNLSIPYTAKGTLSEIKTVSPEYIHLKETAARYAKSDAHIFLYGEHGTGKQALAQAIHNASERSGEPFLRLNCAAISEAAAEAELFGSEDTKTGKAGALETANYGTLLLEEIGLLSLRLQARLLDALESGSFQRTVAGRQVPVNLRLITTSSTDLEEYVARNMFDEKLYYRISVLNLEMIPLRERKCDIPILIHLLLAENRGDLTQKQIDEISHCSYFTDYHWPGNLAELTAVIERFCIHYTPGTPIAQIAQESLQTIKRLQTTPDAPEFEKNEVEAALRNANGNLSEAAKLLNISRTTLWRKRRELGLL